ncbi:MAG: PspC domain-containing protein [Saccharopolyspora sp.]|uniref:PspC domain-containing protein n=1 Tax=Saccharopolyspora TaxID=1835 RepID=UPI00190A3FFA|nr:MULTISPECIES: PspC domain-containing protein [unclassified Saccharopolyspora]MBK0865694.1 PspC domain-containing protein [Saccharopolyspora sp. HNM0986]MBQ6643353.1 PspC domain-containing protein [Saccharopolyspora sp.]
MTENVHIAAPTAPESSTGSGGYRRFTRSRNGMVAGVCAGAAEYFGIDPTLIRVLLLAATILGFGTGIVLYLAAWLLAPQE